MDQSDPHISRRESIKKLSAAGLGVIGISQFSGKASASEYFNNVGDSTTYQSRFEDPGFPFVDNVATGIKYTKREIDENSGYTIHELDVGTYGWSRSESGEPASVGYRHETFIDEYFNRNLSNLSVVDESVGCCNADIRESNPVKEGEEKTLALGVLSIVLVPVSQGASVSLASGSVMSGMYDWGAIPASAGAQFENPPGEISDFYHNMRFRIKADAGERGHMVLDSGFGACRNEVDIYFADSGKSLNLYIHGDIPK